jgi:hypothetical protein
VHENQPDNGGADAGARAENSNTAPSNDAGEGGGSNAPQGQNQGQGQGQGRSRHRDRRNRRRGGGGGGENRDAREMRDMDDEEEAVQEPRSNFVLPANLPSYSLADLKRMPAHLLLDLAETLGITEGVARMRKQDVTFAVLKVLTRHGDGVAADGVLEILPDGFGFLRSGRCQLPGRPGRCLHLAQPDPSLQPAYRRLPRRPHPQPEGRRALFRRCPRSTPSTANRRRRRRTRCCSKTSRRCSRASASPWSVATAAPRTSPAASWTWWRRSVAASAA